MATEALPQVRRTTLGISLGGKEHRGKTLRERARAVQTLCDRTRRTNRTAEELFFTRTSAGVSRVVHMLRSQEADFAWYDHEATPKQPSELIPVALESDNHKDSKQIIHKFIHLNEPRAIHFGNWRSAESESVAQSYFSVGSHQWYCETKEMEEWDAREAFAPHGEFLHVTDPDGETQPHATRRAATPKTLILLVWWRGHHDLWRS